MADADTTDFDVDAEAPGGGVREDTATDADEADDQEERLVAEGEIAGDYLEELLDVLDFDGDIDLDVEGNRAVVSIDGSDDLNKLVGRGGEVLDALQELTRLAVHQKTGVRSRLMLDIARWRRRRREELAALADEVARRVAETGDREELVPMTPLTEDRPRCGCSGARCAQRKRRRGARTPSRCAPRLAREPAAPTDAAVSDAWPSGWASVSRAENVSRET